MDTPLILVVDDDDGLCEAVTAALEDEGYRVVCALGIAALGLARGGCSPPPSYAT